LLGIFAFFVPAATWNPVSRFNLTRAIVEQRSLAVDSYVASTGDRSLVGGRWYSDKPPVVAVLAVPAYAAVYASQALRGKPRPDFRALSRPNVPAVRVIPNRSYQQAFHASSVATAGAAAIALALMLFTFLRRRTTPRAAFLGSSVAVLASPILPYGTSLYGHVPAAAFVFAAILSLDQRGGVELTTRKIRFSGFFFALAAGCEYLMAVPVVVAMSWFLWRSPKAERPWRVLNLFLGGLVPAALVAAYLTAIFGAPWRTGYSFESQPDFAAGHASGIMGLHLPQLEGLFGLTFGVRRGLFYLSPVLLIGTVLAFRSALRRRDTSLQCGLGVLSALLLLNAGYYMWWGGAATGPRHLIPGLAFLGVGVAAAFRSQHVWLRFACAVLAVVSVVFCTAATLVGIEAPETGDILRQWVWRRVNEGRFGLPSGGSNLGMKLGLTPALSVLPLLIWMVGGFVYLFLSTRSRAAHTVSRGVASARAASSGT
jgi:hypothetical protein